MPKYYTKHHPPPTISHRFSPERDVVPFTPTISKPFPTSLRVIVVNKPSGDVGRHYRLKDVIGLSDSEFKEIQTTIHEAARATLDTSKAYGAQDEYVLSSMCMKMGERYQMLSKFPEHWVVRDFLRMYLKNTSSRARYKGIGRKRTGGRVLSKAETTSM